MAKRQVKKYKFDPIARTITVEGQIDLAKLLLITNVTQGKIYYNFADTGTTGGTSSFLPGAYPLLAGSTNVATYSPDVPFGASPTAQVTNSITGIGETTFTINNNVDLGSTAASTDALSIFVEENFQYTRPWHDFGTDAIERTRTANPQSLIDADFEYGLQPTKWQGVELASQYPGVFELPASDLTVSNAWVWSANAVASTGVSSVLIQSPGHGLVSGDPIIVQNANVALYGFPKVTGGFQVFSANTDFFSYYAKGNVGVYNGGFDLGDTINGWTTTQGRNITGPGFYVRKGGFYSGAALPVSTFTSDGVSPQSNITISFGSSVHGFVPGMPVMVYADPAYLTGSYANLVGSFYTNSISSSTSISFQAKGYVPAGGVLNANATNKFAMYVRSDGFFTHRPGDGGILLGTNSPIHGVGAIRQSKKYFRYQSGKGLLYTTGVLFAPNYDVVSVTNQGTSNNKYNAGTGLGGIVEIKTAVPHGLQLNSTVRLTGVRTVNVDGQYNVDIIVDDVTIRCYAVNDNMGDFRTSFGQNGIADIGGVPKLYIYKWTGSCIRTGPHDDANGMFWEYDGQYFNVVKRTSTLQIAGTSTFTPNSNNITGVNTAFDKQLHQGDKIVIKGMVHKIAQVNSATSIAVTPDYRGASTTSGNYIWLVQDLRIPQSSWNHDTVDGTGGAKNPSGYKLDPNRMQMVGIQFTWYGAGFMDFMVRGIDATFIIVHRIKNNNVNITASMRTANLPVRYHVINEPPNMSTFIVPGQSMTAISTSVEINSVENWPAAGYVWCGGEIMKYTSITPATTGGFPSLNFSSTANRGTTVSQYIGGQVRTFYGSAATTHAAYDGIELISLTATPNMSHWGSSYIMDGGFDYDRGYQFNYSYPSTGTYGFNVTTSDVSYFAIRLAPSASQGLTGDLGDKELLNRAQLLLQAMEITANVGGTNSGGSIQVTGVLNPSNIPADGIVTWTALNSATYGGQPSFTQANTFPYLYGGASANVTAGGEQLFKFNASTDSRQTLDLSNIKELAQGVVGGRGVFPNGPDTLYINMKSMSGSTINNVSVTLRWAEAQA